MARDGGGYLCFPLCVALFLVRRRHPWGVCLGFYSRMLSHGQLHLLLKTNLPQTVVVIAIITAAMNTL